LSKIKQLVTGIKGSYLIGLFVILFLVGLCSESKAEVTVEAGATYLSNDFSKGGMLVLSESFDKYTIGVGYISKQFVRTCTRKLPEHQKLCDWDIPVNVFIEGRRSTYIGKMELSLGMAYFQNKNRALSRNMTFSVLVGYPITDRLGLRFRHYSNAGSGPQNLGQDALNVVWTF
jgi:hypothetical protein